ncbi:MAG: DUF11 domain-containing protein, partial [Sorangiineae bacterium]|nr:DUF11 domain-containing protein [Sorangiineae bacterium]
MNRIDARKVRSIRAGACVAIGLAAALALPACGSEGFGPTESGEPEPTGSTSSAVFVNGSFEDGANNAAPPNWTVTTYRNPGITISDPQTRANLALQTGGTAQTFTLTTSGGPESQADPDLGTGASFRWPKFGSAVAVVNRKTASRNANSMKQTMTVDAGDIDPVDGLAHVRFVAAPVLQDPNHPAHQQPYFFIQLTNVTRGNQILYQDFNFANQPGVPWKTSGSIKYTDWALVDIAPGNALLAPGDQVELEVIAAGCAQSGHWGQVYVDGIGPTVPGLYVYATGPAAANRGTDITYTLTYKNDGSAGAAGTVVQFNTPPNTTFTSVTAPGLTCTAPSPGNGGLVSCTVGALAAGASGNFEITVRIAPAATVGSTITAGNYDIRATSVSPLLGPKVYTKVTDGITYAELVVKKTASAATVPAGGTVTYTIVASNDGPNGPASATIVDTMPSQLASATWTCAGTGGATCAASGAGNINDAVSIPVNQKVTYTITGTVRSDAAAGQFTNTASVTLPPTVSDPTPSNNADAAFVRVTVANGETCGGDLDCTSGVCASDGKCGYPNDDGPCTAQNGDTVCRSGACSANGTCMPAGGCNVDADCASTQFCDTSSHSCTDKLANGTAIPTIAGHDPALDGTCTGPAGAAVCVSAVCDTSDDQCGYADGTGPCDSATADTVCRSGACSANGTCMPSSGCNVDADCASTQFCDTSSHSCTDKLANGTAIPTIAGHVPPLDGACTGPAGAVVCVSAVCDTSDDQCGYANGTGPCDTSTAATVCRSGVCSANGTCMPAASCNVDADCSSDQFCETSRHEGT